MKTKINIMFNDLELSILLKTLEFRLKEVHNSATMYEVLLNSLYKKIKMIYDENQKQQQKLFS